MNQNQLKKFKTTHTGLSSFESLSKQQKITAFKINQAQCIQTLHKMLNEGTIEGVTDEQLKEFQEYEDTSVNALIILNYGGNLDEETREKLKRFKSHLIDAIDVLETRGIHLSIKYDLDEFKKIHAHFVDIISRMHAGDNIDAKIILELEKKQEDLLNDLNHFDEQPILTERQKIMAFKINQAKFIQTLYKMMNEGTIEGVTVDQLQEFQKYEDTSVKALKTLNAGTDLDEETKGQLKAFKSHLINAIDELVTRGIDLPVKYDLDEFKSI